MSRKTYSLSAVALVGAASLTLSGADFSGAFAQDSSAAVELPTKQTSTGAVEFISREVVQPLPQAEIEPQREPVDASSLRELVSIVDTDETLTEQMRCLAGAVYFESRGEPLSGQLAVAQVVINRAEDRRFPASYCSVVYQRAQFSFIKNGRMPAIKTSSNAWDRAKAIAAIAHEGMWESEASDSLYFHATYVSPRWARVKSRRTQIKTHIFYR